MSIKRTSSKTQTSRPILKLWSLFSLDSIATERIILYPLVTYLSDPLSRFLNLGANGGNWKITNWRRPTGRSNCQDEYLQVLKPQKTVGYKFEHSNTVFHESQKCELIASYARTCAHSKNWRIFVLVSESCLFLNFVEVGVSLLNYFLWRNVKFK